MNRLALGAAIGLFAAASARGECPKAGLYSVKIDSAPQGAAIYVNDKTCKIGVTPWTGKLDAGDYSIIVEAPGSAPQTRQFHVERVRRTQELFVEVIKGTKQK